jgi:hypothetical protein
LLCSQKGLHEFALAANDHAGEPFEPASVRYFRLGVEPRGEQAKLIGGDIALLDSIEEMLEQGRREIRTRTLGTRPGSVEAAGDGLTQKRSLGWIGCLGHALGERGQFSA